MALAGKQDTRGAVIQNTPRVMDTRVHVVAMKHVHTLTTVVLTLKLYAILPLVPACELDTGSAVCPEIALVMSRTASVIMPAERGGIVVLILTPLAVSPL